MKVLHGLMDGQVLQRDRRGNGMAKISGRCGASGLVELRITKNGRPVRGGDWKVAGVAEKKLFQADLSGIRTGGPYAVEMRIGQGRRTLESLVIRDVFVGDVWMLGGQSNMEGIGNLADAPRPHPLVRAFFMRDEWGLAEEKLHYLSEAVDSVHNSYGDEPGRPPKEFLEKGRKALVKGVSPGLVFGLEMLRRTRVPQGLIPCAHGGTSMAQWSPSLRDKGGASLYGAMMRRYEKLGQPIAGLLWYQGESDANPEAAAVYTPKMIDLVSSVRRDMGLPNLPWIMVQLGCHAATEDDSSWNNIQEQQRHLPEAIPNLDVAPAIDLELDDGIHIGGKAQHVLGRRLARLAARMVCGTRGVKPGIVLKNLEIIKTPSCSPGAACMSIQLTYGNVAGRLQSPGRPAGFVLLDQQGRNVQGIFKITLEGNQVVLHTNMWGRQLEPLSVSYGHGRFPYCNITDSDGMSIPCMQAVPVPVDKTVARDCRKWQTALLRGVKSISGASYAVAANAGGWRKAPPRYLFGVLPKPAGMNRVGVYAMRTILRAEESLDALLIFGANAPFKMWLNGKAILADPAAGIPIDPDRYKVALRLKEGRNELLVAFAPPSPGAHLGLCARIGTPQGKIDGRISLV